MRSSETKTPIMVVSRTRKATMYSLTRCSIEAAPGDKREDEGRGCRDQRRPTRVGAHRLAVAPQRKDERRADERHDEKPGEEPLPRHQRTPPARYQVIRAATPISM